VSEANAGYGDRVVVGGIELMLRPGDRIGLLGRNGAGKSTLVKLLAGELAPLSGVRREGKNLVIGYFNQHCVEALRPDESPLQHLMRIEPLTREQELRDFIGGFDFRGDMATRAVAPFSGGEKARLALALIVRQRPNLLLLDEPTNHLDLEMREALTIALQEFDGTIVLVSHDRHLLRATADTLLLVANGRVTPFDGDLDDYASWLDSERARAKASEVPSEVSAEKAERKQSREESKAERQALLAKRRPLIKEIETLEQRLAGWQGELKLLESRLSDATLYAAGKNGELATLTKRQGELARDIDRAEARWLEAQEALDALPEVD
ncbi:MAG TPA: ATP-binding cassette domain-containing protein, partial [Rhodocyclaceae bacterium]|nr:ATP-binding cassette domain-containing protein [Rhodocyclaceae bacterium]